MKERMVSSRVLFMNNCRHTGGCGQYGIRGHIVNRLIDVQETVQLLPRALPEDMAVDVHLKRCSLLKSLFKSGLVTKRTVYL
ncbi:hypothetical protein HPB48_019961 [Haemaphysalis longicornis]|uniref:Uncharacterized protein n=1 Tax=Haemaphysalis longicornis TaxID=44386 RepID=A0A9J6GUS4_HAELO|nr:hypothetical protein HPB48_019961 [Haemaphysalis longicornis]